MSTELVAFPCTCEHPVAVWDDESDHIACSNCGGIIEESFLA